MNSKAEDIDKNFRVLIRQARLRKLWKTSVTESRQCACQVLNMETLE